MKTVILVLILVLSSCGKEDADEIIDNPPIHDSIQQGLYVGTLANVDGVFYVLIDDNHDVDGFIFDDANYEYFKIKGTWTDDGDNFSYQLSVDPCGFGNGSPEYYFTPENNLVLDEGLFREVDMVTVLPALFDLMEAYTEGCFAL